MISQVCEGWVRHRRFHPVRHQFRYRMFMLYLDLAELPRLFDPYWLWSARRPALAWFRRKDHYGETEQPLDQSIRDLVESKTGYRPGGAIRLLTHLRYFGYAMNPVSFYYCFNADGQAIDSVVAEVSNTPWGERHCYVLDCRDQGTKLSSTFDKTFHVSPFMGMGQQYQWRLTRPGRRIAVHMRNLEDGVELFDATMQLRCQPVNSRVLRKVLLRYPLMTLRVVAAIYFQALKLYLKGCPFIPHPKHAHVPATPAEPEEVTE